MISFTFEFNDHPLTFNHWQARRFKGKYGMKRQTKYIAEKGKIIKLFYITGSLIL
jgi:hypothetical protein